MATVEALRVEVQQTLAEGELKFEEFKRNATLQLATLESKVDNVDTFQNTTGDEVNTLTGRMNEYDQVSTNFANQMQAVQAEQTKGLTDMRAGLDKIFSQTGAFTTLSNLVEYHTKTIKELEDKLKSGGATTTGDRRTQHNRSILDFKALSDIKILEHGGGFLTWADTFRNVFEQYNRKSRTLINFLEKLTVEQVELKVKEDGSTQFEAIFSIFDEKTDNPDLEHIDFEEMNIAIWAALVHKTSGEARKKVNNTGQGSGLYAYIRVWRWFTGQSTTTQAESRAKILHPDQVKKIELLADVIEDWERRLNLMEEKDIAGGEDATVAKTPEKYKTMALWCMLPDSLRDEVDLKQGEHGGGLLQNP